VTQSLPSGVYDLLVTEQLAKEIRALIDTGIPIAKERLDPACAAGPMARAVAEELSKRLADIGRQKKATIESVAQEANRVLGALSHDGRIESPLTGDRLISVGEPRSTPAPPPIVPLSEHSLITGERGEANLGAQLIREIASANEIDLLCSFIRWSGVRVLMDALRSFCERPGTRLRVLTTTYVGASEAKAIEAIARLPKSEVRISHDTEGTRLHAKSWILKRNSGFGTSFVGSANISHPALTEGLEWTLRVSQSRERQLWEKIIASFETSWNDSSFIPYDPNRGEDVQRLRHALATASPGRPTVAEDDTPTFDIQPKDFQREILERLDRERRILGRRRQLIVAATGTGKTMIAAFDYRRFRQDPKNHVNGRPPRLLYLVHREEILRQALRSFRAVLRMSSFGCLFTGNDSVIRDESVFATIQSFTSRDLLESHGPGHWDYVVLDEAHHAEASSYREILGALQPKVLLGLTATPERADGLDIAKHFGSSVSAEIRLPDAIERRLLVPFHYFVARDDDSVQLSNISFSRGRYDSNGLSAVFDGNTARAHLIVQELQRRVLDTKSMRAIGFCAGRSHARFMARIFSDQYRIPAIALTGEDSSAERQRGIARLRDRTINVIFVADLFNEGVDIPEVDTVMFLRPTESLTVFLQQLGRGLRRCEYKEALTVLDFVANVDQRYRLDRKFRGLLSRQSLNLERECRDGFPTMPAGCVISMDRESQERVLESIRRYATPNQQVITDEIQSLARDIGRRPKLIEYLNAFGRDAIDVFRRGSWTELCAKAGFHPPGQRLSEEAKHLLRSAVKRLCFINDRDWSSTIRNILVASRGGNWRPSTTLEHLHVTMLGRTIWQDAAAPTSFDDLVLKIQGTPPVIDEITEILEFAAANLTAESETIALPFDHALKLHAQYTADQIQTALGLLHGNQVDNLQAGVRFDESKGVYLMFVTLEKAERDYSESIRYDDYAVSARKFHWQSQNTASPKTEGGLRIIEHKRRGIRLLLFVRHLRHDRGITPPYCFLGEFYYEEHLYEKPMSVVGHLSHPIPESILRVAMKAG
jgi:superfamily II DNA or RNA helicase/HKD family nuclease